MLSIPNVRIQPDVCKNAELIPYLVPARTSFLPTVFLLPCPWVVGVLRWASFASFASRCALRCGSMCVYDNVYRRMFSPPALEGSGPLMRLLFWIRTGART